MVALRRFRGTIGYAPGDGSTFSDPELFTVFITDPDPPLGHQQYATIDAAIAGGGFFAQYLRGLADVKNDALDPVPSPLPR
jgi:hypothetical protein